jgi:penicillin G amidase
MTIRSARLGKVLGLLLFALLALFLAAGWLLYQSLPQTSGQAPAAGLENPVSIGFDEWQRPYVQAASLSDALRAQGWLHAQNRLWQMELLRRAGQGRMAELLGGDLLATDRELWRLGVPQLAATLEENSSGRTLELIDHYLQGVNSGIEHFSILPPEFLLLGAPRPRWQRRDVFALGALMAYQSANNMDNELLRLALAAQLDAERFDVFLTHDRDNDYPYVIPSPGSTAQLLEASDRLALTDPDTNPLMPRLGFGSNGWVVSAANSASGYPLYAFDSHDTLGLPNLFYETHLFFGQGRQLRGWSVAGLPGVINGFNESIAWGFTNIGDTQDLFVETRSAQDPLLFREGDQWYQAQTETVSIPVKGGSIEDLTIIRTRNGPLISEDPPISLAWAVQRIQKPNLDSLLTLNLARNWTEFTAALDTFPAPTLNATYADVHGTIGFRTAGVIPRRGAGEGLIPLDGRTQANHWQGMVPAAQMPQLQNPSSGFLAAANAGVNAPGDGPLVSADNAAPYRIARIRQVLASKSALTMKDMQDLQTDWTDGQAQQVLPTMLAQLERQQLDASAAAALPLLERWAAEPMASRDSSGALIFQQWYMATASAVFSDSTAELYSRLLKRGYLLNLALDHLILDQPSSVWWQGDQGLLLAEALNAAVKAIGARLGPDPKSWRLEQRLQVRLQHELGKAVPELAWFFNQPDEPWGGSPATVGRARYSYLEPFVVDTGATVRAVVEMAPVPRAWSVMPGGQSGHPLSQHYADQYAGWLAGELYPLASLPEAVGGERLELVPVP